MGLYSATPVSVLRSCDPADITHCLAGFLNRIKRLKIDFVLERSFRQVDCESIAYLQVDLCIPQQQRSWGIIPWHFQETRLG